MPDPTDALAQATGLQHALSLVLPAEDPARRVLDAAVSARDPALIAAALAYVDRILPDQKKGEIEIARQLRMLAADAPPRWAFVVDIAPMGVADLNAGTPPKWTAKHAYLIDPSLPAGGTRITFLGGARSAHLPTVERVAQSVRGTMNEHTAGEEIARLAIFAKATQATKERK